MTKLTHFDGSGAAHMVDVGAKVESERVAVAQGQIHMQPDTQAQIAAGTHGKGDVLGVARLAGIMAAKRTAELIPLCHPLPLTHVSVEFELDTTAADNPSASDAIVRCTATAQTVGRTGVEMEAITAVQIALLTIYDMCKAVDRGMQINGVCLIEKRGGKSGHWRRNTD